MNQLQEVYADIYDIKETLAGSWFLIFYIQQTIKYKMNQFQHSSHTYSI